MTEKELILTRVLIPFHNKGAKTFTMNDASQLCGISKKTLYQYFPTKEILLNEVVNLTQKQIKETINNLHKKNLNPIEELFELHQNINKIIQSDSQVFMYQLMKYYPKIYTKCNSFMQENMQLVLTRNFTNGIKKGLYKANLDISTTAQLFFSCHISIKTSDLFLNSQKNQIELGSFILRFFLESICTPTGITLYTAIINSYEY